jgi:hypothetical protein
MIVSVHLQTSITKVIKINVLEYEPILGCCAEGIEILFWVFLYFFFSTLEARRFVKEPF